MSFSHTLFVQPHISVRRRIALFFSLLFLVVAASHQPAQAVSLQEQTYSISGRVTDRIGGTNGISGATVTLSGTRTGVTTTDANGNYSFTDLPAGGNYTLSPSKAGQYISYGDVVNNLSGNRTVNLSLEAYVTVNLRVTDAAGKGVGDVEIKINNFSFSLLRTNSSGTGILSITIAMTSSVDPFITLTPSKPGYIFSPPSVTFNINSGNQDVHFIASVANTPVTSLQFGAPSFVAGEGDGSATISVTRTGDTSTAASVNYFTGDAGVATQKSDYTMATGTLQFAPGETSKTFRVLITDNAYVQGIHTLFLQLANAKGGAVLGSPTFVTLSIIDNDFATPTTNPLDNPRAFVRQHYYDFLNRLPDQGGLNYWTEQIAGNSSSNAPAPCPAGDRVCENNRRINVSAAFFVENEFQQTGYVIYRLNRAALGMIPDYSHFMVERNNLTAGPQLQQSTLDYVNGFVQGGAFKQFYPDSMTPAQFVNKLFDTAGLSPFTEERQQKIQDMTTGGKSRAQVLLEVIELPAFKQKEYNPAFVLMQYYGFLRRDPDPEGYRFWLDVLNSRAQNNYRAMVCAFLTSTEYQQRLSPVVTHTNIECGQ